MIDTATFTTKYPLMSALCVGTDLTVLWYDVAIVGQAESLIAKVPSDKRKYLSHIDGALGDDEIAAATGLTVAEVATVGRACVTAAGG